MAMTPEGRVKAAVKRWLKEHGIWFYMPVQNGMGVVGIPDFICCANGHFLAIETKAPGKRGNTTANQDMRIAEIHKAGGSAVVVDDASQLETLRILLTRKDNHD
jgi:hypothetical protein